MGLRLSRSFLSLTSSSLGQISLMPFSLRVSQVIPLIVVERQAKFTLITAEMVAHKIRVFGEIDGLEGEPSEALTAVDSFVLCGGGASATGLGSPLPVHCDVLNKTLLLLCSLCTPIWKRIISYYKPKTKIICYKYLLYSISLSQVAAHSVSISLFFCRSVFR